MNEGGPPGRFAPSASPLVLPHVVSGQSPATTPSVKVTTVALGLVHRDGRWFLQRRELKNQVLPGRWEFPGGKAKEGETPEDALRRELQEELDWRPSSIRALECAMYHYAGRVVSLHPFLCEGNCRARTQLSWGWFTLDEVRRLPIPEANFALLERLR